MKAMEASGRRLRKEKLRAVLGRMERARKGVRRIAAAFNREMASRGRATRIGKTRAYELLRVRGLVPPKRKPRGRGKRAAVPVRPFERFAADFGQKPLAGGGRLHFLPLIDLFDRAMVLLDAHEEIEGEAVKRSLEKLRKAFPGPVRVTVDNGTEFRNDDVLDYCRDNDVRLDFTRKGSPWENPFAERVVRTVKEEYLNLRWLDKETDLQAVLDEVKHAYNRRPHMALGYRTPLEALRDHLREAGNGRSSV